MKKILVLFILSLSAGMCVSAEGVSESTIERPDYSRAPHAIPSEKLRSIMLNLNSSLNASKHSDIEKNPIEKDQMSSLVKAVGELLLSAEEMANQPPDSRLEKYKQIGFKSMANNLYIETKNLKKIVDGNDYDLIEAAYARLNDTCNDCHNTFR